MSRTKYRIGQISNLLGLTPEALRYYEHEGIINPEKSSQSGYRLYDAWDIHILVRARTYRKFGFSLDETVKTLEETDFEAIDAELAKKESELRASIFNQQKTLSQLRRDRFMIADAITNIGKFRIEVNPAMHIIETQNAYNIIEGTTQLYHNWIERIPFVKSGGLFELDTNRLRYGLIAEDSAMADLDPNQFEHTIAIPQRQCVTTFFPSGSEHELDLNMFKSTFTFMENHGLTVAGDPFARAVLMTKDTEKQEVYYSWYQGWVPFEGECEYCLPPACL